MRHFIDILNERVERIIVRDHPVTVLVNPPWPQVKTILDRAKFNEVRWFIDDSTGDLYVWDSALSIHDQASAALQVNYDEHGFVAQAVDGDGPEKGGFDRFTNDGYAVFRDYYSEPVNNPNFNRAFPEVTKGQPRSPGMPSYRSYAHMNPLGENEMFDPMADRRMAAMPPPAFDCDYDDGRKKAPVWKNPTNRGVLVNCLKMGRGEAKALIGLHDIFLWGEANMYHDDVRACVGAGKGLLSCILTEQGIAVKGQMWDDDEFEQLATALRMNPYVRRLYGAGAKIEQASWNW